ncbi:hypothetical protein V1227_18965 [Lentzea sp. DG1S-22]|uniref:hypothetical protein n=1 Tax=Lentzea sp. DG1S-22 TaxID=3108822 RepID=UPI002E78895B|nr:hypothetical protein [Lentzea sp. DG1S-22]WVH84729.1 hypothetical protein V1227_18965 [Lentzea sp. DG1S-22]
MGHQFLNNGPDPALHAIRVQFGMTGGGVKTVAWNRSVRWSYDFRVYAHGYHPMLVTDTSWWIRMPPDGTVIPNPVPGGDSVTVTGGRIPMGNFTTLWYVLPIGTNGDTYPNNFRITSADDNDAIPWEIPSHWVMIVTRNDSTGGGAHVRWGTGEIDDCWEPLTLTNGWVNYGEEWATAQYRKGPSSLVEMRGLVRSGNASHVTTLPVGCRPSATLLTVQNVGDTFNRVDIRANGEVHRMGGGNAYLTINATFFADQ